MKQALFAQLKDAQLSYTHLETTSRIDLDAAIEQLAEKDNEKDILNAKLSSNYDEKQNLEVQFTNKGAVISQLEVTIKQKESVISSLEEQNSQASLDVSTILSEAKRVFFWKICGICIPIFLARSSLNESLILLPFSSFRRIVVPGSHT
jgi:chromosome segregation ATPase